MDRPAGRLPDRCVSATFERDPDPDLGGSRAGRAEPGRLEARFVDG